MPNDSARKIVTAKQWGEAPEEQRAGLSIVVPSAQVETLDSAEIVKALQEADAEEIAALEKAGVDPSAPERVIPYTFSTEQRDRDGDRIMVKGWNLTDYRKNPVILPSHQYGEPAIGRSLRTWKDTPSGGQRRLRGLVQFTPKDVNPLGFMIYELAKGGYQRAGSVGFDPFAFERDPDLSDEERRKYPWGGFLFKGQHLLEFSPTAVPSNPGALAEAKSKGVDVSPFTPWVERILDNEAPVPVGVEREALEKAAHEVQPPRPSVQVPDNVEPEPETKATPEPDAEPSEPERKTTGADVMLLAAEAAAAVERFELGLKAHLADLEAEGAAIGAKLFAVKSIVDSVIAGEAEPAPVEPETKAEQTQSKAAPERDPFEGVDGPPAAQPEAYDLASFAAALADTTQGSGAA